MNVPIKISLRALRLINVKTPHNVSGCSMLSASGNWAERRLWLSAAGLPLSRTSRGRGEIHQRRWSRFLSQEASSLRDDANAQEVKAVEGPAAEVETISVTFVDRDGVRRPVRAPIGSSMLQVAHENSIDLEGACEGSLACSTCHVYVSEPHLKRLSEPSDEENDMLDLAFGLQENSRLGCQIIASRDLDGMELTLPQATRNMAVDGYVAKPH
ncbi:hypothetical protein F1559_003514 [Cyanidiococcus yangmingshanensis]|uniref:2Fe-2S ferredoxin n=1 Tax=Cyanidiococcus yangmingshanensis TaxID=2690220 RepID=A0A7J7IM52_9RHOD|nr:hypothetical protein F1559_003514 [Cyanidiococcus yangmingshanensis]